MTKQSQRHDRREWLLTTAAIVSTACAAYVVFARMTRESQVAQPLPETRVIAEWPQYGREGNRMGPDGAPVTIVNFSDFECPYCVRQAPVLRAIARKFPNEVVVVYRHRPGIVREFSRSAAIASECAAQAGAFEAYHDLLFDQDSIGAKSWTSLAEEAGISDLTRFTTCLDGATAARLVDRDAVAAASLGVVVTPTLLINDILVEGYVDGNILGNLVEAALLAVDRPHRVSGAPK